MTVEAIEALKKLLQDKDEKIQRLTNELAHQQAAAEKKLQQKQFFYENILSLLPEEIYWLDLNNVYLGCNDLLAKNAELFSRKEIVGKGNHELPWADKAIELNKINRDVMDHEHPHHAEEYAVMADGMHIYSTIKTPLYNEMHQVVGMMGLSRDITEQKKLEAALRKAREQADISKRSLQELMTNIRANLSIPLTGLIMLARHLASVTPCDSGEQPIAELLSQSSQQLFNLLNALFAITENKKFDENEVVEQAFSLSGCIQDIHQLLIPLFKVKKINFEKNIDANVSEHFIFDKTKLHNILLNLLISIIQNTNSHSILLHIESISTDKVYNQLSFTITQTSNNAVDHISFESLAQTDANLSIAQQYISLLGGEIEKTDSEHCSSYSFTLSLKMDAL